MLAHTRRRRAALVTATILTAAVAVAACDKVPLLAPTGTVITLFPAASTVPLNGQVEIVATVIENGTTAAPPTNGDGTNGSTSPTTTTSAGAGTPVQNGTVVSFTTTIGRIEPAEARTHNGQVRVMFMAGSQSGTATITAFSGGASGRIENLRVGTAAVERVLLSANPQTLGPSGGSSEISARVEDVSGLALSGIPVTFTTDNGLLSTGTSNTDQNGIARTTLTTTRAAKVTANVAGKTAEVNVGLNPRTGVSITAPTGQIAAGQPATFTVAVSADANVRDVRIDYGDGRGDSLGALSGSTTVSHIYNESGTYRVVATATDATGFGESVATSLTVLPAQPPAVTITASNTNPSVGETVILTANVSGNTSTILRYEWNFGAGATPATATTTGNRASASWSSTGTKVISVTVFQATGPSGDGQVAVVVRP
jgi:hypothetical protein